MIAGAIAFFLYASIVSTVMMRYKPPALAATLALMPVWFRHRLWALVCMDALGRAAVCCSPSVDEVACSIKSTGANHLA
jgi:hypothetical protein